MFSMAVNFIFFKGYELPGFLRARSGLEIYKHLGRW